jgi:hypothetical protein
VKSCPAFAPAITKHPSVPHPSVFTPFRSHRSRPSVDTGEYGHVNDALTVPVHLPVDRVENSPPGAATHAMGVCSTHGDQHVSAPLLTALPRGVHAVLPSVFIRFCCRIPEPADRNILSAVKNIVTHEVAHQAVSIATRTTTRIRRTRPWGVRMGGAVREKLSRAVEPTISNCNTSSSAVRRDHVHVPREAHLACSWLRRKVFVEVSTAYEKAAVSAALQTIDPLPP